MHNAILHHNSFYIIDSILKRPSFNHKYFIDDIYIALKYQRFDTWHEYNNRRFTLHMKIFRNHNRNYGHIISNCFT